MGTLFWLSDESWASIEPPTTIYNRFNRWSRRRLWVELEALVEAGVLMHATAIDSTYVKPLPPARYLTTARAVYAPGRLPMGFPKAISGKIGGLKILLSY